MDGASVLRPLISFLKNQTFHHIVNDFFYKWYSFDEELVINLRENITLKGTSDNLRKL